MTGPAGAPSTLSKIDAPPVVAALGGNVMPSLIYQGHGPVQLTPQLEITSGATGFNATCTGSIQTSFDGGTRVLPNQTVSVAPNTTEDYDSVVAISNGISGANTIVVSLACTVTSGSGSTINASVTAIS